MYRYTKPFPLLSILSLLLAMVLNVSCSKLTLQKKQTTSTNSPSSSEFLSSAPPLGALTIAAFEGDLNEVKSFLSSGSYINENIGDDENQVTPLIAALVNDRIEVAKFLLGRGAAVHPSFKGFGAEDIARLQNQFQSLSQIRRNRR